jgi:hypothetical protein
MRERLRTLPFWREVFQALDLDVCYLVAIRNPMSVARSRAQLDSSPRHAGKKRPRMVSERRSRISARYENGRSWSSIMISLWQTRCGNWNGLRRAWTSRRRPQSLRRAQEYANRFLNPSLRHTRFTDADLAQNPTTQPDYTRGLSLAVSTGHR